jgi:hypothetical protein
MVKLFAKNSATLPAKSGPNRILGNRLKALTDHLGRGSRVGSIDPY